LTLDLVYLGLEGSGQVGILMTGKPVVTKTVKTELSEVKWVLTATYARENIYGDKGIFAEPYLQKVYWYLDIL